MSSRLRFLHVSLPLFFIFLASISFSQTVSRGPYLQMGTESSMTIRWRTSSNTDSVVRYGMSPGNLNQAATVAGNRTEHEVALSGLAALTQYYYSVGSSSQTLAGGDNSYRFTTSPASGAASATRIWIIGDSGTANANAATVYNAYLSHPGADDTHLWLMLGDNAYNDGADSEYQSAVFNMYPELLRRTPLWTTLGNHDGHSADSSSQTGPYYDIFTLPTNAEAGGLASGTEAYYSFDYGDIHFICLDSYDTDRSVGGAMLTWLENDLAATNQKWIIAFWHHPPYTKGSHNSDSESALIDMRERVLPILESYGVDLVFTGHSHSYERSFFIDGHYGSSGSFSAAHLVDGGDGREDGDGAYAKAEQTANAGAVYTVAGASGKTSGGSLNHPAMFASLNQLGSVVLDINGNRLDAVYLRSDGTVSDYYTVLKGPDMTSPQLASASATSDTLVLADFSEALDETSAEDPANYSLDGGAVVTSASLAGAQVALTTSPLMQNQLYTLTVNNVTDISGNAIAANSQTSFTYVDTQTLAFQNGVAPSGSYSGAEDTYLASGLGNSNFGSSTAILADGSDGSNGELAALIRWDVSSIPVGATVIAAEVMLEVFNPSAGAYHLYKNTAPWTEAAATWNNIDPSNSRGDQIGNFTPSSSGAYNIVLNANGIALAQAWVDGMNDGLLIMTGGTSDGIDMRSSDYSGANLRPKLSVTYSLSGGPPPNQGPVADFSYSATNLQVDFTDASSDADGAVVGWLWDFGDGNTSTQASPQHTYAAASVYDVTLTVTDDDGGSDSYTQTIAVTDGAGSVTVELQAGLNGYNGTRDTYVASGLPAANYGDDAAILADADDGQRNELIALLSWDVSAIPPGATILSASITLQVFNKSNNVYNLWRMNQAWQEDAATWSNTEPELNRGVKVGSFTPTSTGSYTIDLNSNGLSMIAGWINGGGNDGVTIESGGTRNGIDMRSREYDSMAQRPKLTVTYQ